MIGIVSTQHSFGGHGMRQRKYRSIQRYRKTVPLCLKELLIRSITQFKFQFTGRNTFYKRLIFILPDERNEMRRFIFPQTCGYLKGEARMKLVRIRQFRFPLIADTVVLLAFQRQKNVILTGIEIMLPILVDIGQITEFERMNRKLIGIFLFPMERIFQFRQPLHTFVAETVRHISPAEQMRIKPCRCHSTGTHTHSFQRITADGGVHHTDIEQRSFLLRCGNISGKQHLQHLLRPIINRITTQLRHHLVYGSLFLAHFRKAVGIPVSIGMSGRVHALNHLLGFSERLQGIGSRFVSIIPVINIPFGIDAVAVVHQFEFRRDTFIHKLPCTVFRTVEVLFYLHVIHKVQIDFLRKVHHYATHEIRTVQHDVQMPRKAERLGVERHESQVHARLSGNGQRIHQIVFVERRA